MKTIAQSTHQHPPFRIGHYRPIYLWGGPGTIRMNRLKFMDQPVDEAAHQHAHSPAGAEAVLDAMHCNGVHLMYNWGFPPEIEAEDWEAFRRAAAIYRQGGSPVFAYIQASNCVYQGSFRQKDWFARDARGKKVYYYSGRYMTCLSSPEWVQHLKTMIAGAIERGAEGIFFDNLWHGAMPIAMWGAWLGAAGCFCERCRAAYRAASSQSIPTRIDPDDLATRRYLRYRADQVSALIAELAAYANQLQPGTPVSANDYVHYSSPTYVIYGQDLGALSQVKPVTMIENFALPRWEPTPRPRLANNALTIRHALAAIGGRAHLSVLSYDVGIGFDGVYPPRRYQQGIAEAAACGASTTIKGTEYFEAGRHTVLTPPQFAPVQQAIGKYNRWLAAHADLFAPGQNRAPVGLLDPGEELWLRWPGWAPIYLGAAQTLTAAGIPWRVAREGDDLSGLAALIGMAAPRGPNLQLPRGARWICLADLPGWGPPLLSLIAKKKSLNALAARFAHGLMNAYFGSRLARRVFDALGLPKLITQSPIFVLPPAAARETLLAAVPAIFPRVQAAAPVLIEYWQRGGQRQIHLVNYASAPQRVRLQLGEAAQWRSLSPDGDDQDFWGAEAAFELDVYRVFERIGGSDE